MARYLYRCRACGKTHEIEKGMDRAGEPETCLECHAETERVFTAPGLTRKGSPVAGGDLPGAGDCPGGCCNGGSCGLD